MVCISTRLDEDIFHEMVGMFDDAAEKLPKDFLYNVSPNNTAGYFVTLPDGDRAIAVTGFTRADDMESRSCSLGLSSQIADFEEAVTIITKYFPLKLLGQFKQGISSFATFGGHLAGYPDTMAIYIQSGEGMTMVGIFEVPGS